jgi:carbamoyltransferase
VTYILGINAFHGDSAACLVRDGELVAAAEEERFRRIKHWAGFPAEAIAWCLKEGGIDLARLDHIAVNQDARASLGRKIRYVLFGHPDFSLVMDRFRNKQKRSSIPDLFKAHFPDATFDGRFHAIEHHLAHLSSAFHASPFDKAAVVSVDGFGDFASAGWGLGDGTRITVANRVHFPHSLGIFYQAMTQFLGFPHYGDEYKVMGLAPYGKPEYMEQMRQLVKLAEDGGYRLDLQYFRHHREKIAYEWENGIPAFGNLYSTALETLLGPARKPDAPLEQYHRDLARSVQGMYEEAFFHLLNRLHETYPCDALAVAGGCGMNSVANGKVRLHTPFRQLYVQSAAGDAGGAIGAAFTVWHQLSKQRSKGMAHAYWGPQASADEVEKLLFSRAEALAATGCTLTTFQDEDRLCESTAAAIAQGKVIGWFQGRMEWGPRALGNRSILGDPRRVDMKDILNIKIKRRESFRPFAPSVMREEVDNWFEQDADVPFMMQVFQIREAQRERIPAVTHVDGSGRLQTVTASSNPRYYKLIAAFHRQTGVPMVLNTSFNENEPVVCRPDEALDCFMRTNMDVLVMGNFMVSRNNG